MSLKARIALKGYSYQEYVFTYFLGVMDVERNIEKIVTEATDTKQFDDLYLVFSSGEKYRLQIKNYPNTSNKDIKVKDNYLIINGDRNEFDPTDNNVIIVNSSRITTDDELFGFACTRKNDIVIIPINTDELENRLDSMYSSEERECNIVKLAKKIVSDALFEITIDNLPPLAHLSHDLERETVILRDIPDFVQKELIFIEGRPGVGKSHHVGEIQNKYKEAIMYRFWTGSQDPSGNERLQFNTFIKELGVLIYKSPRNVDIDELVERIKREDLLVIIDGLDHVENYNPKELDVFFSFFDKLKETRTRIYSRPLRHSIPWKKEELFPWTEDEARRYLKDGHGISDRNAQDKIYSISGGYPIITYYLAAEYLKTGKIDFSERINSVEEYYKELFENGDESAKVLSIFTVGSCFFTKKEISIFFGNEIAEDSFYRLVNRYPFLFVLVENRISLYHDSLCTFVRSNVKEDKGVENYYSSIRESIIRGESEYFARIDAFHFDEEFYSRILAKYSDIEVFKNLIVSTIDYDSIQSLYRKLHTILRQRKDVLNVYQYYSFALIYLIVNRNDLIGDDCLVFQILKYLKRHGNIEDAIFSTGHMWNVFLACRSRKDLAKRFLSEKGFDEDQFFDLLNAISDEYYFFEKQRQEVSFDEFKCDYSGKEAYSITKYEALRRYLVSIYFNEKKEAKLFDLFNEYIESDSLDIEKVVESDSIFNSSDEWAIDYAFKQAKYRLHELGLFGDDNLFRNKTVKDIIYDNAVCGSYEVMNHVTAYIRLANQEGRDIDIENAVYAWLMHYQRKDYSVFNIGKAFACFERCGEQQVLTSINLLKRILKQSEKGVSGVVTLYINSKSQEDVRQMFTDTSIYAISDRIHFFELKESIMSLYNVHRVSMFLNEKLDSHRQYKVIEDRELGNIFKSKYAGLAFEMLSSRGYSVSTTDEKTSKELRKNNIKVVMPQGEKPFCKELRERGYIQQEDFDYIKKEGMDIIEVASYLDGNYSCFPFVEVFDCFSKEIVQKSYLDVLHTAMFANIKDSDMYYGTWFLLVGNVPAFLERYGIEIDWKKLYAVFDRFLDISLIKSPSVKNNYCQLIC